MDRAPNVKPKLVPVKKKLPPPKEIKDSLEHALPKNTPEKIQKQQNAKESPSPAASSSKNKKSSSKKKKSTKKPRGPSANERFEIVSKMMNDLSAFSSDFYSFRDAFHSSLSQQGQAIQDLRTQVDSHFKNTQELVEKQVLSMDDKNQVEQRKQSTGGKRRIDDVGIYEDDPHKTALQKRPNNKVKPGFNLPTKLPEPRDVEAQYTGSSKEALAELDGSPFTLKF